MILLPLLVVRPLIGNPEYWQWDNIETLITSGLIWVCIILWVIVYFKKQ